ncbi:hypothetical protein HNQ80_001181 [Anaerosolibacter carboniphilus]|uniref:Uncharacterized protein n=1 Tax=Anaerosolibacter carboniphilus TaxID=1417629 RepID=A0A841KW00_9FIRM|nr:hypothetical protein [Anaerosolibacter carboniphilus]MBB6215092.1 hypothetical protein [Anaerosolibacter carboniphilus]
MAKIYVNEQNGMLAKASSLSGIKGVAEELGFTVLISNYRSFFYSIFRKYNQDSGKFEFVKLSKTNKEKEEVLRQQGYEKIKDAYSNEILQQFLFLS